MKTKFDIKLSTDKFCEAIRSAGLSMRDLNRIFLIRSITYTYMRRIHIWEKMGF